MTHVRKFQVDAPTSVYVEGLEHGPQPIPAACVLGGFVFTGAVLGKDPSAGGIVEGDREQAEQVFANAAVILRAAGSSLDTVGKVTLYVAPTFDRESLNDVWTRTYPDAAGRPARHVLVTSSLPGRATVKAEFTAFVTDH